MRDLPAPTRSAQQALARMYAQRVPSRPKQIGRMPEQEVDQPWYKDVANALGSTYEWLRDNRVQTVTGGVGGPIQTEVATPVEQAVEPLRVAGRRAVGDITAIPGVGADSPSYTAQEFRDENPWVAALKTALDYGSIAALGAQGVGATRNAIRPQYGVHVSPTSGLTEISPRSVGATQAAAADAKVGSTYMWDARSPRLLNEVFDNPQMAGIAGMGETPTVYVTRARGQVFQDANALNSPAIRVAGPQQVLGEVPYTREALLNFLESQGIRPRGVTADRLAQFARGLSPTVRADVANRPFQMAEERLRAAIRIGRENPSSQWGALAGLDETADIGTLLNSPEARGFFDNFVEMSGGTRGTYPELPPRSALAEEMVGRATVEQPSSIGRGVYAVDDEFGNVTLYQIDDNNTTIGELKLLRTPTGFIVTDMSAEPGSRTAANLLAGAKITGQTNFPGVEFPITPSANLSMYSRPMVEKLQAAGLVPPEYKLPLETSINSVTVPFHSVQQVSADLVPRLRGIRPEEISTATRDIIRALAKAKQEGRVSPDAITTSRQLQQILARKMSDLSQIDAMTIGGEEFAVPRGMQLSPLYRDILAKQDRFYLPEIMDELGTQYVNSRWQNPYEMDVA